MQQQIDYYRSQENVSPNIMDKNTEIEEIRAMLGTAEGGSKAAITKIMNKGDILSHEN
jgi:hypothetical protein